jgi:hypothetical protein
LLVVETPPAETWSPLALGDAGNEYTVPQGTGPGGNGGDGIGTVWCECGE